MVSTNYYLSKTLHELCHKTTEKSLTMLSESIFQTLTGTMLVGDSKMVQNSLHVASKSMVFNL